MVSQRKARVVVVFSAPVGYRVEFFERLAEQPEIDLTVLFCASDPGSRGPARFRPRDAAFKAVTLPGFTLGRREKLGTPAYVNPTVTRWVARSRADVVVVGGYAFPTALLAILAARYRRVPWILWSETHSRSHRWDRGLRHTVRRMVVARLLPTARAFLTPGTLAAEWLEEQGVRRSKIFRVANTCDIHRWRREVEHLRQTREAVLRELNVAGGGIVVTVARLHPEKRIDDLIRAFGKMRETIRGWELLIAGGGPERRALEELVIDEGIGGVRFLGPLPPDGLYKLFAIADLFCLPSTIETWGVVLNEALAAGVPAIVTQRVGAAADLIEGTGAGIVVPERDPMALAEAMITFAKDEDLRGRMKAATWKAVSPFSYEASAKEFVDAVLSCG